MNRQKDDLKRLLHRQDVKLGTSPLPCRGMCHLLSLYLKRSGSPRNPSCQDLIMSPAISILLHHNPGLVQLVSGGGDFGSVFFDHYQQTQPLRPGFFECRRDIYNLYPLLVHVRLFGGNYVSSVERILSQLGY